MEQPTSMLDIPPAWDDEAWKQLSGDARILAEDERNEAARRWMLRDLEEIMSLPSGAGIRVFKEMMMSGSVFSESFYGNSETYFKQGLKAFALHYYNLICESPNGDKFSNQIRPPYSIHPYFIPESEQEAKELVMREVSGKKPKR